MVLKNDHQYPLYSLSFHVRLEAFDARVRKEMTQSTYICELKSMAYPSN